MPENFAWEGKPSAASPGHSSKPFTPRAAIKFWEKSGFLMSGYSRIAVINGCYTRKKGIGGVGREYMWHSYEECGPRVLPLRRSFARQCLGSVFPGPACSVSIASADLDKDAEDYVGEKPDNKGNPNAASTQIPGYKSITADAKTGKLSVALMNPEGNPCYFVIHILVDDRELYASKMLAPGKAIYEAGLEKILPKGTYAATIKYECFHLESLAPLNGADIQVELIVA